MSSLNVLLARKAELDQQIQALQSSARSEALAQVKALMADHGLSVTDLAGKKTTNKASPEKGRSVPVKYRNETTGDSWSGRGLRPKWLTAEIDAGRQLEDFAV